jgi:hypothetical protein
MKKMILLSAITIAAAGSATHAQDRMVKNQRSQTQNDFQRAYFGMGLGLDYGGIGIKAEFLPIKYVGIFAGVGYNIASVGVNGGVSIKALPNCRITPTAIGMYGYNSVIVVSGASQYNKVYYGPTVGIGGELKVGRHQNKLYAALLYPFRSEKFDKDYDVIKTTPGIEVTQEKSPVTFSFGFNFAL